MFRCPVGDMLLEPGLDGSTVVSSVREEHPEGVTVYNLEVEGAHTYFVRAEGSEVEPVWVHNAGYDPDLGGGIRALEGADESTFGVGRSYAALSKSLYQELSWSERYSSTLAVSEAQVDGRMRSVYAINGGAADSAKATISAAAERDGAIYLEGVGNQHAEKAIYDQFGEVQAIGVSHYRGPCPTCRSYFADQSFANIYYDSRFV
jgi:hypothetical protein